MRAALIGPDSIAAGVLAQSPVEKYAQAQTVSMSVRTGDPEKTMVTTHRFQLSCRAFLFLFVVILSPPVCAAARLDIPWDTHLIGDVSVVDRWATCTDSLSTETIASFPPGLTCPPCGPLYCKDPVATERARAAKKAQMRADGYPERLIKLLDQYQCVACIRFAPDTFSIMIEYAPGTGPSNGQGGHWTHITSQWTAQDEALARKELREGKIKSFAVMNASTACKCCGEKDPWERPDWNSALEINTGGMLTYNRPEDLGPDPPDLKDIPQSLLQQLPDIGTYKKPPKRQAHVICPGCEPLAKELNSIADTLDYLWDKKVNLQKGMDITNRAIVDRENQIAALEYQQNLNPQGAVQQQIDELERVNAAQSEDIRSDLRKLEDVDRQIAEVNALQKTAEAKLLQCEQTACKPPTNTVPTTPTLTPTPPTAPAKPPAPCQPPSSCNPPTDTCTGPNCPSGSCTGPGCTPTPPCTGSGCPQTPPSPCKGPDCGTGSCTGPGCTTTPSCTGSGCPQTPPTPCTGPGCQSTPLGACQPGSACTSALTDFCTSPGGNLCTVNPANLPPELHGVAAQINRVITLIQDSPSPKRFLMTGAIADLIAGLNAQSYDQMQTALSTLLHDVTDEMIEPGDPAPWSQLKAIKMALYENQIAKMPVAWQAIARQICQVATDVEASYSGKRILMEGGLERLLGDLSTQSVDGMQVELAGLMHDITMFMWEPGDPQPLKQLKEIRMAIYNQQIAELPPEWRSIAQQIYSLAIAADSSYSGARVFLEGPIEGLINGLNARSFGQIQENIDVLRDTNKYITNSPDLSILAPLTAIQTSLKTLEGAGPMGATSTPGTFNLGSGAATTVSNGLYGGKPVSITIQITILADGVTANVVQSPGVQNFPSALAPHFGENATTRYLQPAAFHSSSGFPAPETITRLDSPSDLDNAEADSFSFSLSASGNLGEGALEFRAVDPTGQVKKVAIPAGVVLEPLKPGSAKPVSAGSGNGEGQQLTAYCLEIDKAPPEPNQMYRIAPQAIQDKFSPLKSVLEAGRKLADSGQLHPDSEPKAYTDFIRQHALWAKMGNWDEQKFTQIFIERTKKNAQEMNVKWTQDMEKTLRAAAPGRWRDISAVLANAQKLSNAPGAATEAPRPKQ